MVYVISKSGKPLMPTNNHAKVRRMLKDGKAKCIKRTPFTIQLTYDSDENVQDITLGVDAGSKHIGLSATTCKAELFASEVVLRSDIKNNLATRRMMRRDRRSRKTRYRESRFDNRRKSDNWLAPSIRAKIDTHLKVIDDVCKILPISEIVIETASFDIQKIKAEKDGKPLGDRRFGEQHGYWNTREYVLHRDNYTCRCCKGKSKDGILNVHHIESRKTGSDAPSNLVTLCKTCHKAYHAGNLELPSDIAKGRNYTDATFMGLMRRTCYERLKKMHPNVRMTYGYITKATRIKAGLEKSHIVDARCISGNPNVKPAEEVYIMRKLRRHNRQIHKINYAKGGTRRTNQAPYEVYGFKLFDKVRYKGEECFIFGRRLTGYFNVRKADGTIVKTSAPYKKLSLIESSTAFIIAKAVDMPI